MGCVPSCAPATGAVRSYDVTSVATGQWKFKGITAFGEKLYAAPFCADALLELRGLENYFHTDTDPIALLNLARLNAQADALDYELQRVERQMRDTEEHLAQQEATLQDLRVKCQKRRDMIELRRAFDRGESCQFYFVDADFIRNVPGGSSSWTLRGLMHRGVVKLITISLRSAFSNELLDEFLSVSHRWDSPACADPSGKQYHCIRDYVLNNVKVKFVWVDSWCLPQGSRTDKDALVFAKTLPHINLLYLTTKVLLLVDLSYLSRFWTQFEAWLSLQTCTSTGLVHESGRQSRASLVRLHNAPPSMEDALFSMWANKTPAQAHEILAQPDVTVTNRSDKDVQLAKITKLNDLVRAVGLVAAAHGLPTS